MPRTDKIKSVGQLAAHLAAVRNGQRIVHCHGVFDLLHVGHIRHLEQARRMGDMLIVTVTPDRFVNKGPNRPAFTERLRAEALAALGCVDYVAVNEWPAADETITQLRPNVYVKGGEYRDAADDVTRGIEVETVAAQRVGAELAFTDDITFSSSALINEHLAGLPDETRAYLRSFARRHGAAAVIETLDRIKALNVLVIGDAIIDEYCYCQAIGKSSKEPILAVKPVSTEVFAGGILAVANHVAPFCGRTTLATVLGDDGREVFVRESLCERVQPSLFTRSGAPTLTKRRYIDQYFFQKLFAVYEMDDAPFEGEQHEAMCAWLDDALPSFDLVIVVDFGHGTITRAMIERLCGKSRLLAINAQSNAANAGYHTISAYPRADVICVAENEMRLEGRDRHGDLPPLVRDAATRLNARHVIVTRGARGCLCYDGDDDVFVEVPALATTVKDRMGAGDTFMAIAASCLAAGTAIELVGFIGNAAGAQAVATVGHRCSLGPVPLIRQIECLLK